MRMLSGVLVCNVALLLSNTAGASVIFDNITSQTSAGLFSMATGALGSPLGDSFAVQTAGTITSVSLNMAATSNTDGGSVLVFLVPDNSGTPSSTGRTLTSDTLLGVILDFSLTTTATTKTLVTSQSLSVGEYWIELVIHSGDTSNGGSGVTSSAEWSFLSSAAGIGTSGQFSPRQTPRILGSPRPQTQTGHSKWPSR